MSLGEKIADFADGIGERIALGTAGFALELVLSLIIAIVVGVILFTF